MTRITFYNGGMKRKNQDIGVLPKTIGSPKTFRVLIISAVVSLIFGLADLILGPGTNSIL